MKKFLINFICVFVPSKSLRRKIRMRGFFYPKISGKNNIIIDIDTGKNITRSLLPIKISINSDNNIIKLSLKNVYYNCSIRIKKYADNSYIEINKADYEIHDAHIHIALFPNQTCIIKNIFLINGTNFHLTSKESSIIIDDDCMLSWGINIYSGDFHPLIDAKTEKIVNDKKYDIYIGKHTWICADAKILKGTYISKNSIIGTSAVVSGKFTKEHTVIAGNPARVVKTGVNWKR